MPSVAKRILGLLATRLLSIDGTGSYVNDIGGRVYRSRPILEADHDTLPVIFIYRRIGGDTREFQPASNVNVNVTSLYEVVGVVAAGATAGDAAEDLLADIERAMELPDDQYLRDETVGKNLLGDALLLVTGETQNAQTGAKTELVGVGVRCVYPKTYGDPDHVQ